MNTLLLILHLWICPIKNASSIEYGRPPGSAVDRTIIFHVSQDQDVVSPVDGEVSSINPDVGGILIRTKEDYLVKLTLVDSIAVSKGDVVAVGDDIGRVSKGGRVVVSVRQGDMFLHPKKFFECD